MIATETTCPVCGCRENDPVHEVLVGCRACGSARQPSPFDESRRSLLESQVFAPASPERREAASNIVEHLESYTHGRRIFDVGFGDGALLSAAAQRNWQVAGIDVAPAARACVPYLADTTTTGDFTQIDRTNLGQFDVVSFFYSLEQIEDCRRALELACAMRAPDGIVCIELVPLRELLKRSDDVVRAQLPARIAFPDSEHVREMLWAHDLRVVEESPGVGWRWIARSTSRNLD